MTGNRWLALAVLFLARTSMGFQFQSVGSVMPILVDELAVSYTTIGTLIGLYLLPGIVFALPAGVLGARFGAKRLVLVGLVLMAAGGLTMGVSKDFTAIVGGRLLSGAGAVLLNVLLVKMASDWFAGREISTAMAVLVASWPLGIGLGLIGLVPLAAAFGWQAVMLAPALACLVCFIAVAIAYRNPPRDGQESPARLDLKLAGREWLLVSCAGTVWATYNVGYIVLVSFLPTLFADRGYALVHANALASWLGWALIPLVPVGGYLADRFGRPRGLMMTSFVVVALAASLLTVPLAPMLAVFGVLAIVMGLPAGPIMALPIAAVRPEHRAAGMGIYFTWYYLLMATLPALAGLARDLTQDSGAPILFAAAMMMLALGFTAGFYAIARRFAPVPGR